MRLKQGKEMTKIYVAVFSLVIVLACEAQPSGRGAASIPDASHKKSLPVIAVSVQTTSVHRQRDLTSGREMTKLLLTVVV